MNANTRKGDRVTVGSSWNSVVSSYSTEAVAKFVSTVDMANCLNALLECWKEVITKEGESAEGTINRVCNNKHKTK